MSEQAEVVETPQPVSVQIDANILWDSISGRWDKLEFPESIFSKYRVLPWHHKALSEPSRPFDFKEIETAEKAKQLEFFIRIMMMRMRMENGIGLAANQIGVMTRILVIATKDYKAYMINPEIVEQSVETCDMEEGCLSFAAKKPFRVKKTRPSTVMVSYHLIDGSKVVITLRGLEARVFLHEFDHLNGIRMIDNADPEKVKYQINRLKNHQR